MTVSAYVPTLEPTDYARRTIGLPGERGTVTVHHDGTGTVHDTAGRAVTTLPAHTVALLEPLEAPAPTEPRKIVRRTLLTRWLRLA